MGATSQQSEKNLRNGSESGVMDVYTSFKKWKLPEKCKNNLLKTGLIAPAPRQFCHWLLACEPRGHYNQTICC